MLIEITVFQLNLNISRGILKEKSIQLKRGFQSIKLILHMPFELQESL